MGRVIQSQFGEARTGGFFGSETSLWNVMDAAGVLW